MIPRDVKSPTIPNPFHRLLRVVGIVDDDGPLTREFLDHIAAENVEIELSNSFERDVVQGVFQERVDGRIKFHTYVVRE
jgi:ornithine decarboxylase